MTELHMKGVMLLERLIIGFGILKNKNYKKMRMETA